VSGTRDARARVLAATVALLREGGLQAATPAAIAERAGAGKMSLYRHFAGKDELVAEALAVRDEPHRRHLLDADAAPQRTPAERLLAMFDRAAERADRPGFAGCPYANACLELRDAAHPAQIAAASHKAHMTTELGAILTELGHPDPAGTALVLLMLFDGAVVHAVIRGDGDPLRAARGAAQALLPQAVSPSPIQ
jgi:AcrR family transcriptional regulator